MRYRYRNEEEMKDSGVEWESRIPEGWSNSKIKYIKSASKNSFVDGPFGSNLKSEHFIDNGEVYVIESNFATQGKLNLENTKTISLDHFETIKRSEVKEGDIVLAKIGAQFGLSSILPNIDKKAVISGNSLKLTVDDEKVDRKYVHYELLTIKRNGILDLIVSTTAQPAITLGDMNNIDIILPDIIFQKKIVKFLDEKIAEFDSIISKKEALIQKLEEAKKSLISEVVTGKVKVQKTENGYQLVKRKKEEMKDSGVEWLGDIPREWDIKPLYINFIENKLKNKLELETNLLSLSYGKIKRKDIESNIGLLPESFSNYQIVNKGDIIFRLTDLQNDKRSLRVGLVEERGIITSAYTCIKLLNGCNKYFYYLFHYYDLKKLYYNLGAGVRQSMSFSDLKKIPIILPNKDQQVEMIDVLTIMNKEIDKVISKTKTQIEKLKEAKQSLISEAVTGKIEILD